MNMKRMCLFLLIILVVSGAACSQNASLRKGVYINTYSNFFLAAIHSDTSFNPKQLLFPKRGSYVIVITIAGEITNVTVGQVSGNKINVTASYDSKLNDNWDRSSPSNPEYIIINSQSFKIVSPTFGESTYVWNNEGD
jgi:hypothetical protein